MALRFITAFTMALISLIFILGGENRPTQILGILIGVLAGFNIAAFVKNDIH